MTERNDEKELLLNHIGCKMERRAVSAAVLFENIYHVFITNIKKVLKKII